jgi:hypothetical protein
MGLMVILLKIGSEHFFVQKEDFKKNVLIELNEAHRLCDFD